MMRVCRLNKVIEKSKILHSKNGTWRLNGGGDGAWRRFSYQCPDLIDLEVWPVAFETPVGTVIT